MQYDASYLVDELQNCIDDAEAQDNNYPDVYVHYQPNYPLKAKIVNVKLMDDGTIAIALAGNDEYGDREAWE